MSAFIEFKHITKVFPGQKALDDVSFSIQPGEIHAIIGENGAGKSTLLNILHGAFPPSTGEVLFEGKPVHFAGTADAIKFGIAKVHQEIVSIPEMTVAENLFLGRESTSAGLFLNKKRMNAEAERILSRLQTDIHPTDRMGSLSTGQKQMVSIAKALDGDVKLISFDEPTSSLSDAETKVLFDIIADLKAKGITILYISHRMNEIFSICDRATILRDGKFINTVEMKNVTRDQIIHDMVGRDVSLFAKRTIPCQAQMDQVTLEVENLSGEMFQDVSFQLHKGEILGFFGLVGAGRTEVMRAIYGADPVKSGTVRLHGKPLKCAEPRDAIKAGIALISENRKEEGIVPNLNNMDNMSLPCLEKFSDLGFTNTHKKYDNAVDKGGRVGLKPNDPNFMTMSLSGGNAQKVILARWMSTDATVMIFDEPTKGIDIGAKADIYHLIEEMAQNGMSIIMISSELSEIMGMSDRVLVMHEGHLTAEVQREQFTEENILNFAVGG